VLDKNTFSIRTGNNPPYGIDSSLFSEYNAVSLYISFIVKSETCKKKHSIFSQPLFSQQHGLLIPLFNTDMQVVGEIPVKIFA